MGLITELPDGGHQAEAISAYSGAGQPPSRFDPVFLAYGPVGILFGGQAPGRALNDIWRLETAALQTGTVWHLPIRPLGIERLSTFSSIQLRGSSKTSSPALKFFFWRFGG